jgi:hypothetical protein
MKVCISTIWFTWNPKELYWFLWLQLLIILFSSILSGHLMHKSFFHGEYYTFKILDFTSGLLVSTISLNHLLVSPVNVSLRIHILRWLRPSTNWPTPHPLPTWRQSTLLTIHNHPSISPTTPTTLVVTTPTHLPPAQHPLPHNPTSPTFVRHLNLEGPCCQGTLVVKLTWANIWAHALNKDGANDPGMWSIISCTSVRAGCIWYIYQEPQQILSADCDTLGLQLFAVPKSFFENFLFCPQMLDFLFLPIIHICLL